MWLNDRIVILFYDARYGSWYTGHRPSSHGQPVPAVASHCWQKWNSIWLSLPFLKKHKRFCVRALKLQVAESIFVRFWEQLSHAYLILPPLSHSVDNGVVEHVHCSAGITHTEHWWWLCYTVHAWKPWEENCQCSPGERNGATCSPPTSVWNYANSWITSYKAANTHLIRS